MDSKHTQATLSDEYMWSCVERRDRNAENLFIYAVKTTGVYCHPGCASRRPNRENVVFFVNGWAARAAGFRPCQRCQPDVADSNNEQTKAVLLACELIEQSEEPPPLDELAAATHYSPSHFHRLFKKLVGVTPRAYAATRRVNRAKTRLLDGHSVTRSIYAAGYRASSRFYDEASAMLGMKPSEYQNGADGQTIRAAVAPTYLGQVLVAATERGLCAIELGDDPNELHERLRERFPKARTVLDDREFNDWIARVVTYLDAPRGGLALPLDIQGTAFQRRVWEALRSIPAGTTQTYAWVAAEIGQPTAARAVARACATNPLAVAIPCHRVVRSDGRLSGYRWGKERKRTLLERESRLADDQAK